MDAKQKSVKDGDLCSSHPFFLKKSYSPLRPMPFTLCLQPYLLLHSHFFQKSIVVRNQHKRTTVFF